MDGSFSQPMDDGFESGQEDNVDLLPDKAEKEEHKIVVTEQMIRYIPPPQQIKEKAYSLHPDMLTGWAPKVPLPKPIPLTFPQSSVTELISSYFRKKHSKALLAYLGPHFDNTYSAWKTYAIDFPYNHLGNQKVVVNSRKFQGMSPSYPREEPRFQSMFESGNLDAVFRVGDNEFDCFMRVDANTRGHLQWYYFKMFNMVPGVKYTINICNFQKAKSLYSRGMKPYIYSHLEAYQKGMGWHQGGQAIEYSRKRPSISEMLLDKEDEVEQQRHFILSFKISTSYHNDTLEIAYCPPYTFTKLNNFLSQLTTLNQGKDIMYIENFCTSLGGLKVPLLTITNNVQEVEQCFKAGKTFGNKILVFVIGRLHPGQANGSHMMEGFLRYLCESLPEVQELRDRIVFKIVPMVNPDGVVIGNYRAGLSGRDFNREFTSPEPSLFVEVAQLKTYLQRCKWIYQKQFMFFLDFHGHSVRKNVFAYGPEFPLTHSKYYQSRLLPKLISKKTSLFRYYSCSFKVSEGKASTARAVLLRSYGIPFVYTIEASNGSYYNQEEKGKTDFTVEKWEGVGGKICEALFDYWRIHKQIEEVRLKRKREKQTLLKNKGAASRRIQSSNQRSRTMINFQKKSQMHQRSETSFAQPIPKSNNILSDILNELTVENEKNEEKCSDDQLSEGGSDSQDSSDDIDMNSMRAIMSGKKEGICRIKRRKTKEEQVKKTIISQLKEQVRMVKHPSFLTECDYESPRKHPIYERKKKAPYIYKKLCSISGSSPSPPPQARPDPNGSAKIVNLNFMLNPVSVVPPASEKRQKIRTEMAEEYENRSCLKAEMLENSRRTYLSLQRESMKKDIMKRMSTTGNSGHPSLMVGNFRNHEVIGKRIFSEG